VGPVASCTLRPETVRIEGKCAAKELSQLAQDDAIDVTSVGTKATAVGRPQYRNHGCFVIQVTPTFVASRRTTHIDGSDASERRFNMRGTLRGHEGLPRNFLSIPEKLSREFVGSLIREPDNRIGSFLYGTRRIDATHVRAYPTRTHRVDDDSVIVERDG
jgi:hypothetical protein